MPDQSFSAEDITFRPLAIADLPLLTQWLNLPHMQQWYEPRPVTLDEVTAKFTPRISGDQPTHCHIALLKGVPFGKIQVYKNADYPDYSADIVVEDGVSLDLFIGNPALLGQGLGALYLTRYINTIVQQLYPQETHIYICHKTSNPRACKASEKAGFKKLRDVEEAGRPAVLMVFETTAQ